MRFLQDSVTGKRLRRHGVSSRALDSARVFAIIWPRSTGFILPLPFVGTVIIIGRRYLDRELDGQLADSSTLAYLVHQYCHALQRLEWGAVKYIWRHVWARLISKGIETPRLQVEREAYEAARKTRESYTTSPDVEDGQRKDNGPEKPEKKSMFNVATKLNRNIAAMVPPIRQLLQATLSRLFPLKLHSERAP